MSDIAGPNAKTSAARAAMGPARTEAGVAAAAASTTVRLARRAAAVVARDARIGQILCLSLLFTVGVALLGFDVPLWLPPVTFGTALGVQLVACRLLALSFDPLSPAITAFSLSFLLRTDAVALSALAAALAIGSKFTLRLGGRHVFNPANFALVTVTLAFDGAWISPGQWGALGLFAVVLAGFGAAVAGHAARLDTSLAFLGAWAALVFGRALWLGDPMAIPLHQLQSGAVLIFAFFMISDPATTPRSRARRILHAAAVAALGFWLQTAWVTNTGPILALALLAPLVALIEARLGRAAPPPSSSASKETSPCAPVPNLATAEAVLRVTPRA